MLSAFCFYFLEDLMSFFSNYSYSTRKYNWVASLLQIGPIPQEFLLEMYKSMRLCGHKHSALWLCRAQPIGKRNNNGHLLAWFIYRGNNRGTAPRRVLGKLRRDDRSSWMNEIWYKGFSCWYKPKLQVYRMVDPVWRGFLPLIWRVWLWNTGLM